MGTIVSRESVQRANAAMISGKGCSVSVVGDRVAVRCRTVMASGTLNFSRKEIVKEANKAFGRIVKG